MIVKVEYYDPTVFNNWEERLESEKETPFLCIAIGEVVNDSGSFLRLAAMRCDENDTFSCRMVIPKGCIVSQKELKGE